MKADTLVRARQLPAWLGDQQCAPGAGGHDCRPSVRDFRKGMKRSRLGMPGRVAWLSGLTAIWIRRGIGFTASSAITSTATKTDREPAVDKSAPPSLEGGAAAEMSLIFRRRRSGRCTCAPPVVQMPTSVTISDAECVTASASGCRSARPLTPAFCSDLRTLIARVTSVNHGCRRGCAGA